FLATNGQAVLAKEVDNYAKNYERPWWKTWSLLPIVVVNASLFGGALWLASGPGGWTYFWTALGMCWLLVVLNGVMFFEVGGYEIQQIRRSEAQTWLPEIIKPSGCKTRPSPSTQLIGYNGNQRANANAILALFGDKP